jgi:RNA polymerase sigma-70 factor (ECF subfamily)
MNAVPAKKAGLDEFEALMRRHNRMLFRTARAILRDDADAEEALQDAYLKAYRSLDQFRGDSKISTWLVRITANEALMRLRKRTRAAEVIEIHASPVAEEVAVRKEEQPENLAARKELRALMESKIDALPEAFRAVFVLRGLEEFSVEETAAALEIPEATVRTRFFRARSLLRESLSRELDMALDDAFHFAGERCDRITERVIALWRQPPPAA